MPLPPALLIRSARTLWKTLWKTMMGQLAPASRSGDYQRPPSQFRAAIDPAGTHPPAAHRYQLIGGRGCPWAHRTTLTLALKGLDPVISTVTVEPAAAEGCWVFPEPFAGCRTLPQLYQQVQSGYGGRATVPLLWDCDRCTIVNNESAEIIVQLNQQFAPWATTALDLYPPALRPTIDTWNQRIYHGFNNGVYRCGFAQTQAAYDRACADLFTLLDELDAYLGQHRYLAGATLTLADVRLFPTLFRFDSVYYSLFKCSRRRIQDYVHLGAYLRDIYQQPGVAATCDLEAIKRDYYGSLFPLNPGGIIPAGPDLTALDAPHGREALGQQDPQLRPQPER